MVWKKSASAIIVCLFLVLVGGVNLAETSSHSAASDLIITEIMYNPASSEPAWEWIELYNSGATTVNLAGFVLDDKDNDPLSSANIAAGTIGANKSAILFNVNSVSAAEFEAAWGETDLIPVTNWPAVWLGNDGEELALWSSFAEYEGDDQAQANAVERVRYYSFFQIDGWPNNTNGKSIYLKSLSADNNVGSNWALSSVGGSTPLFAGFQSQAAGGNSGNDIGSPGIGPLPEPTPVPTATSMPLPTATDMPLPTATNMPLPTATNMPLPTATNVPLPTATDMPLPTATNVPLPTATSMPLPTATTVPLPTATNVPLPTATDMPLPTATNVPLPTATSMPLPTATDMPLPTATNVPLPTATNVPLPTATNVPLPTATDMPPPTVVSTPIPTAVNTPVPTAVNTLMPTATSIPIIVVTISPIPTGTLAPTETVLPMPTASPIATALATQTAIPEKTAEPTAVATEMPVVETPTAVPSVTPVSLPTQTLEPPANLDSQTAFLPIVANAQQNPVEAESGLPDLIVDKIVFVDGMPELHVKNIGPGPVEASFWVDLFVNPDVDPVRPNDTLERLRQRGFVWGVADPALPIPPQSSVALRLDGPYFSSRYSTFKGSLSAGDRLVIHVDSAHAGTDYGGLLETHEKAGTPSNNIHITKLDARSWGTVSKDRE